MSTNPLQKKAFLYAYFEYYLRSDLVFLLQFCYTEFKIDIRNCKAKGGADMKEKCLKPQTELNVFHLEDVITTSGGTGGDDGKRDPIELPDL